MLYRTRIVVKNANLYYIGFMVGSNKALAGPAMHGNDAVFYVNERQRDIITKFLNKFDMDGLRYTVELI